MPTERIPSRKKLKNYSQEDIVAAVRAVQENRLSIRRASIVYNVPRTTVGDKIHGRRSLNTESRSILSPEEEEHLVQWILEIDSRGSSVTCKFLSTTLQGIFKQKGRETPFTDSKPGWGWYRSFRKRHPEIIFEKSKLLESTETMTEEEKLSLLNQEVFQSERIFKRKLETYKKPVEEIKKGSKKDQDIETHKKLKIKIKKKPVEKIKKGSKKNQDDGTHLKKEKDSGILSAEDEEKVVQWLTDSAKRGDYKTFTELRDHIEQLGGLKSLEGFIVDNKDIFKYRLIKTGKSHMYGFDLAGSKTSTYRRAGSKTSTYKRAGSKTSTYTRDIISEEPVIPEEDDEASLKIYFQDIDSEEYENLEENATIDDKSLFFQPLNTPEVSPLSKVKVEMDSVGMETEPDGRSSLEITEIAEAEKKPRSVRTAAEKKQGVFNRVDESEKNSLQALQEAEKRQNSLLAVAEKNQNSEMTIDEKKQDSATKTVPQNKVLGIRVVKTKIGKDCSQKSLAKLVPTSNSLLPPLFSSPDVIFDKGHFLKPLSPCQSVPKPLSTTTTNIASPTQKISSSTQNVLSSTPKTLLSTPSKNIPSTLNIPLSTPNIPSSPNNPSNTPNIPSSTQNIPTTTQNITRFCIVATTTSNNLSLVPCTVSSTPNIPSSNPKPLQLLLKPQFSLSQQATTENSTTTSHLCIPTLTSNNLSSVPHTVSSNPNIPLSTPKPLLPLLKQESSVSQQPTPPVFCADFSSPHTALDRLLELTARLGLDRLCQLRCFKGLCNIATTTTNTIQHNDQLIEQKLFTALYDFLVGILDGSSNEALNSQQLPHAIALDRLLDVAAKIGLATLSQFRCLHELRSYRAEVGQPIDSPPEQEFFLIFYKRLTDVLKDVGNDKQSVDTSKSFNESKDKKFLTPTSSNGKESRRSEVLSPQTKGPTSVVEVALPTTKDKTVSLLPKSITPEQIFPNMDMMKKIMQKMKSSGESSCKDCSRKRKAEKRQSDVEKSKRKLERKDEEKEKHTKVTESFQEGRDGKKK